ncbi:DEAD/DEAH box helicase [Roseateles sp. DAIF2]|nr:DEAD/DEAH box helicase [Roseateles sp. DAIF2]
MLNQPEEEAPAPAAAPAAPAVGEAAPFRARLLLQTLSRGDGLLGLTPQGAIGPRGEQVTVARVDWIYRPAGAEPLEIPAPRSLLNSRPGASHAHGERLIARDLGAEAEARDQLWATGLLPLEPGRLQWRSPAAARGHDKLWTLAQEEFFGDFWLEQVPLLKAHDWEIEVRPGFAHRPAAASGWQLKIEPVSLPNRQGSWLVSLGVEVDGENLDLAPLIADLLRRDSRWSSREALAGIDDLALIPLRAPGGRRVHAPAELLKAIVGAMVDLLTLPRETAPDGALLLDDWDALRLAPLLDDRTRWQIHGDADLRRMAQTLLAAGSPPPVAAPAGLALRLRPYQLQGLAWLQYLRAQGLAGVLADDMGLGKTAQTLAHVLLEKEAGRLDRPALVVLPTSLLFNWQAEARRIAPGLRVLTLHGPQRHEQFAELGRADLVLTSYALLWRDARALQAQPWHLLVLDEAQWVKNAAGRSAKALRQLRARHRLALTGTPLENHLGELWAQFDFLMPGFLGDARSFQQRWRKPIEEGGETLRAELLARRVRPFILRRRKSEVAAELPPLTETLRRVALEGRQLELYESVRVAADIQVRRALAKQGFGAAQITVLDALLKLRQVCCDPRLLPSGTQGAEGAQSAKLALLLDMLPELLAEGRRVLVFSQFARLLELVEAALRERGLDCLSLTGATAPARRAEVVRRFQAEEVPLLLVSLKAGGVGLNLTAADMVIHLDPWWNPAVQDQASARAHRIGQDKPVLVYQLVVEGSIEERMLELQRRKRALAEGILGSDPAEAAKFTEEDLKLLLAPLG